MNEDDEQKNRCVTLRAVFLRAAWDLYTQNEKVSSFLIDVPLKSPEWPLREKGV